MSGSGKEHLQAGSAFTMCGLPALYFSVILHNRVRRGFGGDHDRRFVEVLLNEC
ncbi:hypothetical protein HMPREF1986_01130 [Oribacterium sp. oral taxon 078 str. F0263]|nr:hypothetical protein HMPREF1986_01130 [Oribacterium sp. oral taxon 078 str. F0263]